jgi:aspartyl protease family protein
VLLLTFLLELPNQLVLGIAFVCMAFILISGILRTKAYHSLGKLLHITGNIGLTLVCGVTFAQWCSPSFGAPLVSGVAMAAQTSPTLHGGEVRVPLSSDGHYWVEADINGVPQRFLIDTGATYTTISAHVAQEAMVSGEDIPRKVNLHTANGDTSAEVTNIHHLQVGHISANDMQAVIAPDMGSTNVLGMNFLSSLESWRMEHKDLVLTAKAD